MSFATGDFLVASAVAAAAVVAITGQERADPIASLVIAALIVPRAITLLRDTGEVLLESTPRGVDLAEVRRRVDVACAAAGRDPATVRLLPVSKTKPPPVIREAYDAGFRLFGENKAQEAVEKAARERIELIPMP